MPKKEYVFQVVLRINASSYFEALCKVGEVDLISEVIRLPQRDDSIIGGLSQGSWIID